MSLAALYHPGEPCPCLIDGCTGSKLSVKSGHVVGCVCRSCMGRRNRKKGQAAEARRHRSLGGVGWTPRDDLHHPYPLTVTTEDKTGGQVPAKFVAFVNSETARHWFAQAEKKLPVGSDALPALYLEVTEGQTYLVVKLSGKALR
jgi:hypothetical protein